MKNIEYLQNDTEKHYNYHPFEFLTKQDEKNIENLQPEPFIHFVNFFLKKSDRVADIGCGGGRATLYLQQKGYNTYALDLSIRSLLITRSRCKKSSYTCGTNLLLPFKTECFDAVVSDGVVHHTPDSYQSLKENVRILKKGGYLYLAVYKKEGYYFYVYTYLGKPIRWLAKNKLGSFFVKYALGFPYYFLHLFKKKSPKTWKGSLNFFYDYILTPTASFYKKEEVLHFANNLGLKPKFHSNQIGNVHIFIFNKAV